MHLTSVSYTINPEAGLAISIKLLVVILSINKPLSELLISKAEDASGPVVPIPTCANMLKFNTKVVK